MYSFYASLIIFKALIIACGLSCTSSRGFVPLASLLACKILDLEYRLAVEEGSRSHPSLEKVGTVLRKWSANSQARKRPLVCDCVIPLHVPQSPWDCHITRATQLLRSFQLSTVYVSSSHTWTSHCY